MKRDRPGWKEVVGVLLICALLLGGLAKLDSAARRDQVASPAKAQTQADRGADAAGPQLRAAAPAPPVPVSANAGPAAPAPPPAAVREQPLTASWLAMALGLSMALCGAGLRRMGY